MNVLGVSGGFGHNAAAALAVDGRVVFAIEEERLSRAKEAPWQLPTQAMQAALDHAELTMHDIDAVALSWNPELMGDDPRPAMVAYRLHAHIAGTYGVVPEFVAVEHHRAHAFATWRTSGWERAAIVVLDDRGEDRSGTIYQAGPDGLRERLRIPIHESLGLMYSGVTRHIGFGTDQAGKTMGLAAYGATTDTLPGFEFANDGITLIDDDRGPDEVADWPSVLAARFGPPIPRRQRQLARSLPEPHAIDLARRAQNTLEIAVARLADLARTITGQPAVALGGGVALNCTANGRLRCRHGIEDLFVFGAAGDGGGAVGAALALDWSEPPERWTSLAVGIDWPIDAAVTRASSLGATTVVGTRAEIASLAAEAIADGACGGWYRGRDEFGPRALGNRSIVARADDPLVADRVNRVKGRELWRPLAPAFPADLATEVGVAPADVGLDFMIEARWPVDPAGLEGTTHVDGSMRPVVIRSPAHPFHDLLTATAGHGIHAVINTSFNAAGEPMVSSPLDALRTFASTDLDFLVLDDVFITKPGRESSPNVERGAHAAV